MKTIDRYVVRNFLFSYLVVLIGFLGLAVVIDASMNLDEFMETVPDGLAWYRQLAWILEVMGNWYLVRVLVFFQLLMPIITVVAAVVTVVMMKRRNEFVPLLGSGVSVYRVLSPVMLLALLASGLGMANQEFLLPSVAHRLIRRPDDPHGFQEQDFETGFVDSEDRCISIHTYVPREKVLNKVVVLDHQEGGRRTIYAERAEWREKEQVWRFVSGWQGRPENTFGPGKKPAYIDFVTTLRPADVDRPARWDQFIAMEDIRKRIVLRPDLRSLHVELHGRYVAPLHAVIILLLGLPLVLMQESKSVIVGLGVAVVICLVYLGVRIACEQLGVTGSLAPVLAVWLPILAFGPVAIVLFDSVRT